MLLRLVPLLVVAGLLAGCADAPPGGDAEVVLTVSAAASLRDALEVIARRYEAEHPGVRLRLNFAASGTLQQQIRRGAPVDVFLSAAQPPMDELAAAGAILSGTRRDFAANELVLVVPAGAPGDVRDFGDLAAPRVERVAIGAPASVPAGRYSLEVLRSLGIAEVVLAKTIQGQHVRQVLGYVELGEVDAGIVYRTDARASERVRVVASAPAGAHPPIAYPAAVISASEHPGEARAFVEYLGRAEAQGVLREFGFAAVAGTRP